MSGQAIESTRGTTNTMDSRRLSQLLEASETDLLEVKREWWDLESKTGKATFVKQVLAMANRLAPSESGFIIIGVEDKKAGGAILGVDISPPQETLAQILGTYTSPVPRFNVGEVRIGEKKVGVIEVTWGDS